MKDCPLVMEQVSDDVCARSHCMYNAVDGRCLYGTRDSTEFARAKGLKPADIDRELVKSETRIRAGLTLFEYLGWAGVSALAAPEGAPDMRTELHLQLNVSHGALCALANEDTWLAFRDHSGTELRHAQVLLLTEAQLEQLQQFE